MPEKTGDAGTACPAYLRGMWKRIRLPGQLDGPSDLFRCLPTAFRREKDRNEGEQKNSISRETERKGAEEAAKIYRRKRAV